MPSLDLSLMIKRLDGNLVVALEEAVAIAVRYNHSTVEIEHWVIALGEKFDFFKETITITGCDFTSLVESAYKTLERYPRESSSAPSISSTIIEVTREAWIYASLKHGRNIIDLLDLLYAILTDGNLRMFALNGMPPMRDVRIGELEKLISERPATNTLSAEEASQLGVPQTSNASGSDNFLESYTNDMTQLAREGAIDPIVGRDAEMRQIVDILVRRRQNNPILVGEAGVGKTAVVEAFALEIIKGNVPEQLKKIRLLSLDLTLLQAGAGVKGEFERRLKGVIDEVKHSPDPIILFIDEAHTMIGAGGQAGQGDAANILKPALARGELRTIAATTWAEYKKYFEKDAALTRRFQTVQIHEPEEEIAIQMVRSLVPVLENHHKVKIRDSAVRASVTLSMRYIQSRQLPDKAVSLLDTACAAVSISRAAKPAEIQDAENLIDRLKLEAERLKKEPNKTDIQERLDDISSQIDDLQEKLNAYLEQLEKEQELIKSADGIEDHEDFDVAALEKIEEDLRNLQGDLPLIHRIVDKETVAAVVARWTGIPIGRLMRDLVETVQTLEERLKKRVVGQDFTMKSIANAMITSHAHLGDERRPPGVFLMVGTSGVGKTETALALASLLYGGEDNLTVINMSEFKEEHKVSLLLGSPPGYVGYGEGGILTEAVRRKPYGALLLDEIDKAHPGVQDIFYQVFDKGMLKDGEGRDVDFKNTTIMMTANTGTKTLTALAADPDTMPEGEALVETLHPELLEQFKPAFLGRVNVIPYLPLSQEILHTILEIQFNKIKLRLADNYNAILEISESARKALIERSEVLDVGARAIETTISRDILPEISRKILKFSLDKKTIDFIKIDIDENNDFLVRVTSDS